MGSIRAITDATGTVIASYEYEPFGVTVKTTGIDQDNLGFAGKRQDVGSGLSYFGARYYDSEIGRFISKDPAQDGRNWYVYCSNNPLFYIDPNGFAVHINYMTNNEIYKETGVDDILYNVDRWNESFEKWIEYPGNDELWEQM